jgi:hypothetical protein
MADKKVMVAGVEVALDHWIGGRRVSSDRRFANASPIDGAELGAVAAEDAEFGGRGGVGGAGGGDGDEEI